MSTVLTKNPLWTSRSMLPSEPLKLEESVLNPTTPEESRPLAYLYCDWDPGISGDSSPEVEFGHYDPVTQTWDDTNSPIKAGVITQTRRWTEYAPGTGWWDYVSDDACQ
ncbi:hypothetical protein SAMN04489712_111231 [Thermomonospora echinospora]|uniref:Uncharacterized protein n=1 Tax=Thermomonospora echinospora TaxID=1992 RepID=A0A1H6CVU3_9ACTN|nr:hypothetical protein [Thermomonospora echinospora]SEG76968.1 hypothetical protein SAMN04489712_111231 [Thermomonospora echinospora]